MTYAPPPTTARSSAALAADALPRVLVLAGAVARSGASVSAAILAASAAFQGRTVCLVDAADGGELAALLGVTPPDVGAVPVAVSATLGVARADAATLSHALAHARAADLVVVDAGARLAAVQAAVAAATEAAPTSAAPGRNPPVGLLVVTGIEPVALAAAFAMVKAIVPAAAPLRVEVLLTGADAATAAPAFAHLDQGARHFLGRPLRLAAAVPDDPSLAVALRAGLGVVDAAAGSPAAAALHALAERVPAVPARPAPFARAGGGPLLAPPSGAAARPRPYAPPPALGSAFA